jgi:hypothetical protein
MMSKYIPHRKGDISSEINVKGVNPNLAAAVQNLIDTATIQEGPNEVDWETNLRQEIFLNISSFYIYSYRLCDLVDQYLELVPVVARGIRKQLKRHHKEPK